MKKCAVKANHKCGLILFNKEPGWRTKRSLAHTPLLSLTITPVTHQHGTSHMPTWWGLAVVSFPFESVKKSNEHMPFVFCLWVSSPVYPHLCSFLIFYSNLEFSVLLGGSSHMLSIIKKVFSLEKLERSLRKYGGGGGGRKQSLSAPLESPSSHPRTASSFLPA